MRCTDLRVDTRGTDYFRTCQGHSVHPSGGSPGPVDMREVADSLLSCRLEPKQMGNNALITDDVRSARE